MFFCIFYINKEKRKEKNASVGIWFCFRINFGFSNQAIECVSPNKDFFLENFSFIFGWNNDKNFTYIQSNSELLTTFFTERRANT